MIKFTAGALFMLVVLTVWLHTRYFPQAEHFESKYNRCLIEQGEVLAKLVGRVDAHARR